MLKKFLGKLSGNVITLLIVLTIVMTFSSVPIAEALNAQGGKSFNFMGYRYVDSHNVEVWIDKGTGFQNPEKYKIFEGTGISGHQLSVTTIGMPIGSNINISNPSIPLGNGACWRLTTALSDTFVPGKVYTVVLSGTINANNSSTLGSCYFNKDFTFQFAVPDLNDSSNNANSTYSSSIEPSVALRPDDGKNNVPLEGTINFTVNMPVANYSDVLNRLVLKKNGVPLQYVTAVGKTGDIYAPMVSDDHTFFFFPMTGQGRTPSYDLTPGAQYTLDIPAIQTVNGQTIPAQTLSFNTINQDIPTFMPPNPMTVICSNNQVTLSWNNYTGVVPPTGYNVYASQDPFWGFSKINTDPIPVSDSGSQTFSVGYPFGDGQKWYFRVAPLNGSSEGGFSLPGETSAPYWVNGTMTASYFTSTSVFLSWSGAFDNAYISADRQIKFNIYNGNSLLKTVYSDGTYSADGSFNGYMQLTGLTAGVVYNLRVEALNPSGIESTNGPSLAVNTAAPTVTGINPTSGPTTGGTSVAITGTGFTNVKVVKFGSTAGTGLTVNSDTSITVTSPAGTGTVDITVTGPNGVSPTSSSDQFSYNTPLSNNADLSNLTFSSGTLTPTFASATTSYTESFDNSVSSVTVTPTTTDSGAAVKVNGALVTSGMASNAINLNVGSNTINVEVTAPDGTTTKIYTIIVIRAATPVDCLVKYQGVQKRTNRDGTYDIRFIATIDTLEPDSVGFVFSRSEQNPSKENVDPTQVRSTTTVYDSIVADGSPKTAANLGGKYIIACTVTGIPATDIDTPLFVRAFSTQGSVTTYTPVHTVTVSSLQ